MGEGKKVVAKQEIAGLTAEERIANDNFDDLDTVAKVNKFLKDAYTAWENGSDDREVQTYLNRMFGEGNYASTDLASFYDGMKGGNADLDHEAILANLKRSAAPEVANAGLPKDRLALSGGSERKLNAQTPYSGKLADQPIFSDLAVGSAEDQALVGKLDARLGRSADGRRAAVVPERGNAETARAARVAGAIGKKVIWVRNLGADGVSDPAIPGVIFLDPGSKRAIQVLAAHELTHELERDNYTAFADLADEVGPLVDPNEWAKFKQRLDTLHDKDGIPRLSEDGKVSEFVANLLADYAYRSHADAAGAEFAARGGDFTGYGGYLREGAQAKVDAALEKFLAAHGHSAESFRNAQTDRTGGAFEGWKDGPSRVSTQAERDAAVTYAKKVLGPKIKVEFQDVTGYSGEFIEATNTIVISTTAAAGTLNTVYHEALHV